MITKVMHQTCKRIAHVKFRKCLDLHVKTASRIQEEKHKKQSFDIENQREQMIMFMWGLCDNKTAYRHTGPPPPHCHAP